MKIVFTFIFAFTSFTAFCQTGLDSLLRGSWNVVSKVEIVKSGGQVIDQKKELYKQDEKFFDFAENGTVTITQDFGKDSEKLPIRLDGRNLYIGKIKKNKIPYLVRQEGDQLKLAKTEGKIKKGKTILTTEQLVLQRKQANQEQLLK
jgi:aminopeptidase N